MKRERRYWKKLKIRKGVPELIFAENVAEPFLVMEYIKGESLKLQSNAWKDFRKI